MKIHVVGLILLPALIAPNLNAQQPTETGSLNALATLSNLRSLIEWESAQSASEIEATDPGTVNRANQQPFFKSLLVPGWGQLSKGQRGKAYAFFAAEAILLTAIVCALVCIACTETKEVATVDQRVIEQVAKIAATFEMDAAKAMDMLAAENMTAENYKDIIAKIALDEKATNMFVELKEKFLKQSAE